MPSATYPDAVDSYLAGYRSAATVAAYRCDLALWQRHCDASDLDPLAGVMRADLERYARQLEHDGRAPATVARRLATLVGFYRWCADEQPRTTIRYDRARHSLDRHASYTVMQYVSGAS